MTVKVEEVYHDGKVDITRVYHDVTEIKEIMNHTGEHNGITDEIHEYCSYWYELWSGETKLGGFSKDNAKVSIIMNKTEQLQ